MPHTALSPPTTDATAPGTARRHRPAAAAAVDFTAVVSDEGALGVIHATGELNTTGGERLRAIAEQIAGGSVEQVELDLNAITHATLDGVRALHDVRAILERAGIQLTITHTHPADYPTDWHSVPPATADRAATARRRPAATH